MSQLRSVRPALSLVLTGLMGVSFGALVYRTARAASTAAPPVKMTSEEDRLRMAGVLHIAKLRDGHNGTNP